MEWIKMMLTDGALTLLSAVFSVLAACLGVLISRFLKERLTDSAAKRIAKTCVLAVEQMYSGAGSEEKLSAALEFAADLLAEKGLKVSSGQMELLIESTLAAFRGAFTEGEDGVA